MITRASRFLLIFASVLLVAGAVIHAAAFHRASAALAASNLSPFFAGSFKLLWLADSTTMLILAAVFGVIAARPSAATRPVVMLVAMVYAAIAVLVYIFLGSFFAGHIMLTIAVAAFLAGLGLPSVHRSPALIGVPSHMSVPAAH
jgi:hypothetical protein